MKQFYSARDVPDVAALVQEALLLKQKGDMPSVGQGKTLVLLFFNSSLRTRLSTQKAAMSLGMQVITMNAGDAWKWELQYGAVMNLDKAEHIKDAAKVISQYADLIGMRVFPGLLDREADYADEVIQQFIHHAEVPVINLESSILHPCQSLADLMTIAEHQEKPRLKVVLSWAPHPKALPQAVANSFLEWMQRTEHEVVITHPPGYELSERFAGNCPVEYDRKRAFENADVVYVKNWSSYQSYGQVLSQNPDWMIDASIMQRTNQAKLMHCLPVRRNVVITDEVLDSPQSLIYQQAHNRTHAARIVLKKLLEHGA